MTADRRILATSAQHAKVWIGRPWEQRATQTYLTVLAATSLWIRGAHDRLVTAALLTASTNLDRLAHQPINVLITSACWIEPNGVGSYVTVVLTAVLVLAPVEARLGTRRWLVAFACGHIGATLAVATGLSIGVRSAWIDVSVTHSIDVGWSYGAYCLAAIGTSLLPRGVRRWSVAVLVAARMLALIHPDFTDVGHAISVLIGFAVGPRLVAGAAVQQLASGRPLQPIGEVQ